MSLYTLGRRSSPGGSVRAGLLQVAKEAAQVQRVALSVINDRSEIRCWRVVYGDVREWAARLRHQKHTHQSEKLQ